VQQVDCSAAACLHGIVHTHLESVEHGHGRAG